jgi:hypothetical protein
LIQSKSDRQVEVYGSTMTKTFKAPTEAEAHAKADAWLESQPAVKNVTRQAYVFRAAFPKHGSEDEGSWTVAVHYEACS